MGGRHAASDRSKLDQKSRRVSGSTATYRVNDRKSADRVTGVVIDGLRLASGGFGEALPDLNDEELFQAARRCAARNIPPKCCVGERQSVRR